MKHKFNTGDIVIAETLSGRHLGKVTNIDRGFYENDQMLNIWSPATNLNRTYAGGWCKPLNLEMLIEMEKKELKEIVQKYERLKALLENNS